MRTTLIADSSGIIALLNDSDSNHKAALDLADRSIGMSGTIVVPCDVLSETLNIVSKKMGRETALKTGETIFTSDTFVVDEINEEIWNDAFEKFRTQPPSVSYTDCLVMATADFYGLKDIFGFDDTFRKNGYHILQYDEAA
jgi:predicted nucleic acid-binding protein